MNCSIWWSIYVRTRNIQKLRQNHLPLITEALGPFEFKWEILAEDATPELLRVVNYQNLTEDTPKAIILGTLARAYRLADSWRLHGLGALRTAELEHFSGTWRSRKPVHQAPAVEDMAFELIFEHFKGMTKDGGWVPVKDQDQN